MKLPKVLFFVLGGFVMLMNASSASTAPAEEIKSAAAQPAIMLPEVRVSGLAEQITVAFSFSKLNKKLIDYAVIVSVRKHSPAEHAGLKPGMGIYKLQDVRVDGVTPEKFWELLERLPKGDEIVVAAVTDWKILRNQEFRIPVKRLHRSSQTLAIVE